MSESFYCNRRISARQHGANKKQGKVPMKQLIITRHPGYTAYCKSINLIDDATIVIEHATADQLKGRHVITSGLPLHLAALCASLTIVPLDIPLEARGKELSIEEIRKYAGKPQCYRVISE